MYKRTRIWLMVLVAVVVVISGLIVFRIKNRATSIVGVTLSQDADPRRQVPIPGVEVIARSADLLVHSTSDQSGAFQLKLPGAYWRLDAVEFQFRHSGYEQLSLTPQRLDEILVVRMAPVSHALAVEGQETALTDVRVRYAVQSTTPMNVGSVARTFEVNNVGNVPCDRRTSPCSPNGKWKAASGSLALDAGSGREFQNVRATCIAGPCPFTRIESGTGSVGGKNIHVSVLDWSDTATFLVEGDVIQTITTDLIRNSYPAIFGREMSFTLPPSAQGVSIEATSKGTDVVYPLGPALTLSWAVCTVQVGTDGSKLYRCELKPGYRF